MDLKLTQRLQDRAPPVIGLLCGAGLVGILAVALLTFHPLLSLWLAWITALTFFRPTWGASLLLVVLSIDTVAPVLGQIFVSFSELQLAAGLLAFLARTRARELDWRPILWGVPFLCAVLLSGIVNIEWYKVPPHLMRASEWLAACFLMMNAFKGKEARKLAQGAVLIAALLYCLAGLSQYNVIKAQKIYSFFNNPNQFSGYLGLLLPLFAVFFITSAGRRIRAVWGCTAILVLICLLASSSRAALLGTAVALSALFWLYYGRRLKAVLAAPRAWLREVRFSQLLQVILAGLAIWLILALGLLDSLASKISAGLEQNADARGIVNTLFGQRLSYFRFGLNVWQDHPILGVGPGRWEETVDAYLPDLTASLPAARDWDADFRQRFGQSIHTHCHSLYIQLGANYGLAGLFGFLAWVGWALRSFALGTSSWCRIGLGLLTVFLIHNIFDVTFPSLGPELGCLIGLGMAGCKNGGRQGPPETA